MMLIDAFFKMILFIQNLLEKIEMMYISKASCILKIGGLSIILTIILIVCRQVVLGEIFFIMGMFLLEGSDIIGWKCCVRKWLKVCCVYNIFFSLIVSELIREINNSNMINDAMFLGIYLFVWLFLSLISNTKTSMLINEILSGMATTIFTIGTYLINMLLKYELNLKYQLRLETLEIIFMSILPVIGVTALCIIMIKVKEYWMKKNKIFEPEKA